VAASRLSRFEVCASIRTRAVSAFRACAGSSALEPSQVLDVRPIGPTSRPDSFGRSPSLLCCLLQKAGRARSAARVRPR
jgi:hypothetical protein